MRVVLPLATLMLMTACGTGHKAQDSAGPESVKAESAADLNPAQQAYAEANARMHAGMGAAIDPDPDVAFIAGMIPHHQGAVEMAEIVLKHGKDPEARALAETVIRTQTAEIEQMQAWLAKRGVKAPANPDAPVSSEAVDHSKMGH